jgi:hypothetical protein
MMVAAPIARARARLDPSSRRNPRAALLLEGDEDDDGGAVLEVEVEEDVVLGKVIDVLVEANPQN